MLIQIIIVSPCIIISQAVNAMTLWQQSYCDPVCDIAIIIVVHSYIVVTLYILVDIALFKCSGTIYLLSLPSLLLDELSMDKGDSN